MWRYIRAFFLALKMTFTGEKPPSAPHAALQTWIESLPPLTQSVIKVADDAGVDKSAREKISMKIDGREQSLHTILEAIRYHAAQEYPYLLLHFTEHSLTAIYASNMNDQYALTRFLDGESAQNKELRQALTQLSDHLQAIPPSNANAK
jgi:hypothetical protein